MADVGKKKADLVELNRMYQDSEMVVPVVQDDMFRKEGMGGQVADVGKKKADLVELNRMDQDSERMVPVVQNDTCRKEQSCTATPPVINMTELLRKPASQSAAEVYKVTAVGKNEEYTQEPTVWGGGDRNTMVGDDTECSMKYGELYVENEQKYESMEDQNTDKDVGGTGIYSSKMVGGYKRVVQCEFVRGVCKQHNLKGSRMVTKTKVWRQKKHGYGWVTVSRVTYTCSYSGMKTSLSDAGLSSMGTSTSPVSVDEKGEPSSNNILGNIIGQSSGARKGKLNS